MAKTLTIVGLGGSLARVSKRRAFKRSTRWSFRSERCELGRAVLRLGRRRCALLRSRGNVQDSNVELQLKTLGSEMVRVAERFATHDSPEHEVECERAAERVASVAV
jgi:hypothetical protein